MHTFRLHPRTKHAQHLTDGMVLIYTSLHADYREARMDCLEATFRRLAVSHWDRLGNVTANFDVVGIPNVDDEDGNLRWQDEHAECAYCGEKQDRTNDQCWLLVHLPSCAYIKTEEPPLPPLPPVLCAKPGCDRPVSGMAGDDCCDEHDWCSGCDAVVEWEGERCLSCGYVWGYGLETDPEVAP